MTDIVGSTEHAAELGDSDWRELVQEHHTLVRRALRAHGGREIDTAGDGFFATFDAPADAIACALEIVDGVMALGIQVRAGAHVGEVEQIGRKVGGITVPIAARIMGEAAPGEILVSSTIHDLVTGARLSFDDRGSRTLKGVPGEWHLYAVSTAANIAPVPGADNAEQRASDRAAAVRRKRSRHIWERRPRVVAAGLVALAVVLVGSGVLVWQPWLKPALAAIPDNSVGLIEGGRNVVTAAIEVGQQPGGAIVGDGALWVTNTGSDTVSQISLDDHSVTRIIDVGHNPLGIAATEGSVWVTNSGSRTVTQISTETARVVNETVVGNGPTAVAAGAGYLWVANAGDSSIAKVDPDTSLVVQRIPVAARPIAIAAGDSGVWVASADGAAVTRIDPATGVTLAAPITLGGLPVGIALGDDSVWVASSDGNVARIDPNTNRVVATVDVATSASSLVVGAGSVWVADRDGAVVRLSAADPTASPTRIEVASSPEALATAGGNVWVATRASPLSHRGGTLRVTYVHRPVLDPLGFPAYNVTQLQADGLVGYRRVGGVLGSALRADLATALAPPTNGGLGYSFQLRPNLVYSTGEPVLAADFRRAIERSFEVSLDDILFGDQFQAIDGAVECLANLLQPCDLSRGIVTDEATRTVTFNLTEPDPEFLYKLALAAAFPIPESMLIHDEVEGAFPGTGPYVVASATDTEVRLTRNPNFQVWDPDVRPDGYPDEIVWTADISPQDQIEMVERGETDVMPLRADNRITAEEFVSLRTRLPAQIQQGSGSITGAFLSVGRAPFDSLEARQAVNMAIDRSRVVDLYGGPLGASITCQVLPPGWLGYEPYCPYTTHPDPGGRWQAPNLDAARALVERSGSEGAHVVVGPVRARHAALRDYMVSVLIELGYDAVADTRTDDESFFGAFENGEFQIGVAEFFTASAAPAEFMIGFTCFGADGLTGFCESGFDELFTQARDLQGQDIAAAASSWAAVDRAIVDQAVLAPVVNEGSDFLAERVGNYQFNPSLGLLFDQLWVQ